MSLFGAHREFQEAVRELIWVRLEETQEGWKYQVDETSARRHGRIDERTYGGRMIPRDFALRNE